MKTLVLLGAVLAAAFARPGGMAKDAHSPCSPKRGTSGAVILKDRTGAVVQKVDAALVNSESVRSETAGTEMSNLSSYHEKLDSSSESKLKTNHKIGFASGGRLPSPSSSATPSALKDAASLEETYSSETSNLSLHPEKPDSSSESKLNANRKIGVASGGRLPSASSNSPSLMSSTPKTAASLEGTDSSETSNSSPSTGKPDSSSESKLSPSRKIGLATGGKLPSAGYNSPTEMSSTSKNSASLQNTDNSETSDLSPYPERPDGSSESNLNTSRKIGLATGGKLPTASSNSPSLMSSTPKAAASLEVTDSSETSNSSPSAEKSDSSSESTLNVNRKVDLVSGGKLPSVSSRTPSETSSTPKTAAGLQDTDSSETSNSAPSFERPCSPSDSTMDDNSSSDLSSGGKMPLPGAVCPPLKSPTVTNTNNLPKFETSNNSPSDYEAKNDLPAINEFQSFPVNNLLASSSVKTQESVSKSPDNIASIETSTASVNNPRADSPDSTSFGDLPGDNVPPIPSADPHADSPPAVSPRYPISHFVPAAPATTVLNLKNAYNFWPYSWLLYNHPANTFIVNVPLTAMCSPPSSNNAMCGLPISSPFADLPGHRFSPDVTALSNSVMDAVQGPVLAKWPVNNAAIPQQLSLDDSSKIRAVYNAEDPEDAVDADVDYPLCAAIGLGAEPLVLPADTTSSAAPSSPAPNTVTFGAVPVRIWAPPAGRSSSQIPRIINFGSFPLPTAVKQATAPVKPVQNTINFGGVSVRTLGQPVTVPLSVTSNNISVGGWPVMVLSAVLAAAIARPGGMSEVEPLPCSTKTRESGAVILKDRIGTNMQAEDATLVSSESAEAETASYERTSLSPSTETPDTPTVTSLNINRKIDLASSSKMPSTGSIISSQVSSAPTNVASLHHTDSSEISGSAPSAERLDSSTEIKLKASTKIALTTGGQVPSDSSISQSQTSPAPENAASLQHTDSSETFNPSPSAEKADCSPESMLKTDSKVGLASGSKVLSPGSISLSQTTSAPKNAASVQDIDSSEMSNSPSAKRPSSSTESNLNANSKIALAAAGQVPSGGSISRSQTSSVPKNPASLQDTDSSEVSISSPSAEKADCSPESMSNTSHKVGLASGGKAPSTGSISHTQTSSAPKSAPGLQDIDSSETSNSSPSAERPNSSSESKLNAISTLALASGGQAPSTGSISQYEMASPPKNAASLQDIDSSETSNLPPSAEGPCSSSESVLDDNSPVNLSSARKIHSPDSVSPSVRSPSLNNVERVPDLETSGVSEPVQRLSDDLPASNTFQNLPVSNLRATSSVNSQASVSESLDNIASVDMPEAFQPVKTPKTDSLASSSFGDLPASNIPASPSADSQEEISPASDPRYPISSLAPTSTGLGLYNAVNHWLCTRPFYSPPANSDSVSLPFTMTYPTPNSNKGKFGLSMSWPFTGLSVESFSPDIFAHSSNVIDTAHCASLADGLANFTPTLRQLSLDECNKVGAFLTTSDRADAGYIPGAPVYNVVGPSAAAVRLSAGTGTSAAPRSQSSNIVVFRGVPIRVWAPPAAPPKSQYPSSINFDGIPISTAVQQAAVPVNPAYNIFNFGGVPVHTFLLSAVLAAAYARPAVLSEAAPSPCSTKTGATSAAILNDRIGAVMQKGDAAPVSSESAQSKTASSETPSLSSSAKKPNSSPESKLNPNSNIGPNLDRKTPSSDSISPSQMSPQSKKPSSHQDIDSSETSNLFPSRETHDSSLEIKLNGNSKVEPISASKMLPPDSISPSRTSPKSKNVIRLQDTDSYETSNLSPYPEKPASSPESKLNPNRKLGLISGSKMPSPASVSQSQTSSASKDIDSSETPNSSPSAVTPESSTESKLNANRKTALASGGQVPSGGSISESQTSLVPKNGATLQDIDSSETSISSPSAEKADCSPESMSNTNYMVGLASGSNVPSTGSISPSETSAAPKNAAILQDIDSSETSKPFPSTERPCSSSESMLDDSSENLSSAGKMPSPNSFTPSERSPSLTNANSDQEFEASGVSDSAQKPNDDLPGSNTFQNSPVSNLRDTSSVNPQESVSKSLGNIARVDTSATFQPTNKPKADSPDSTSFGDLAASNFPSSHSADSQDDLSPASDPRYLINSLVPSASATPGLGLHHAAGYWLCSGPFNRHQDDSDSVNLPVTMTYPPPSSNKAMFGLSTSTPLADLSGDIFSPDGIAHSSNVMDNAGGAVLTDRPASFTPTLRHLSLDELSKVGAVLAAEDPAAVALAADTPALAVAGPSAASVELCAGTAYSSAPQSQTPNTVTFGGVPVHVWAPPAAPSTTQYPRIINFGGVPVPANVQEAAAAHNTINFGGVPVRTLSHPVTVPLSVISNTINFSGWPVLPVVNSLLHQ
ncbi:mucin-17-like [Schistocerca americana]|uniref:mucin-17-like n=1 Tax=Schistocerca americana TaxID=7009 RepID=UPI001F501B95|nr:mucin-17-like [Schistocerca americana]